MIISSGPLETVVEIKGESLTLYAERAALWQGASTLLVADPHWGKAAAFRSGGIPVPSGTTRDAIDRLTSLITRTAARRIVFLGDLLHAREGRSSDMIAALSAWRLDNPGVEVLLVRGNHDRGAGDPPAELRFECVDAPYVALPFVLAHYPVSNPDGYVIAGHLHPGIRLHGAGRQRERLPCFVFGRDFGVLPAFGDFTGLADVDPGEGDEVYAVAGEAVVRVL